MIYTVTQLLQRCRVWAGEERGGGGTSIDIYLDFINDAQEETAGEIISQQPEFMPTFTSITMDGTERHIIPASLGMEQILGVEILDSASNPSDMAPVRFDDRFNYLLDILSLSKAPYYVHGNVLGFPAKPVTGTVRLWYSKRPAPLFHGLATAADSTHLTFDSSNVTDGTLFAIDDWYNGMYWLTSDGQLRGVTDYVGATYTAEIDQAWSTNPTTDAGSLISPVPLRFQELIPLRAGKRLRIINEDDLTDLYRLETKLEKDMKLQIKRRNVHEPRVVRKLARW